MVALAGGDAKVARARELGATWAFDYNNAEAWPVAVREALGAERGASLVLDGVGGAVGRGAFELLAPGGRMVVFGWSSGAATALTTVDVVGRGVSLSGARIVPADLRRLETAALEAVASGRLRPLIHPPFALRDAAAAHAALEARATAGKVVLST